MAGANLNTLQPAVEQMVKRDDISSDVVTSINEAILDIVMTLRPMEADDLQTGSTTAGTDTYALDSDALTVEQVVITNVGESSDAVPIPVNHSSPREWMLRGRDSDSRGTPKLWLRRNNNIELFGQIPDDNGGNNYNYEIAYVKRPTLLATATGTTAMDLNEEWDEAVELLAAAKVSRKTRDWDAMGIFQAAYMELIGIREMPRAGEAKSDEDARIVML